MSDLIKDTASVSNANNAYADIDKLISNQNSLLEQQQAQQNEILNQQTQMQIDQINRNKAEVDKETAKTNSGLYAEYKKASNPYGANAEQLFTQGLGNSGYAESTQTSLYNTYQKNVTDTINTATKLKSDFDFQIQQAQQNRDLQQAQYALELYQQKMNLLTQEYDLKNNKEQDLYNRGIDERNYNYQVGRDQVADSQWEKEYQQMLKENELAEQWRQKNYDYQVGRDQVSDNQWQQQYNYQVDRDKVSDSQWQKEYDYQVNRDAVADNQWEKEFALAQASASKSKGSSSGGSSSGYTINMNDDNETENSQTEYTRLGGLAGEIIDAHMNNPKTREFAENLIYQHYKSGKITAEEAEFACQQLGI